MTFLLLLFIVYSILILVPTFHVYKSKMEGEESLVDALTVVIPVKNEATNILKLLESITQSDEDSVVKEILVVDDYSEDDTAKLMNEYIFNHPDRNVKLISNKDKGKKSAIETGVELAQQEDILFLDGDVHINSSTYKHSKNSDLSNGSVLLTEGKSKVEHVQAIQQNMLQVLNHGSIIMGSPTNVNAANLKVKKSTFLEVNPYEDNRYVMSGDDLYLLKAINKKSVAVISSALESVVYTEAKETLWEWYRQNLRWNSKIKLAHFRRQSILSLLVFIANLGVIVSFLYALLWLNPVYLIYPILKFIVDFMALFCATSKYSNRYLLIYAPLVFITYPFFLIAIAAGRIGYNNEW